MKIKTAHLFTIAVWTVCYNFLTRPTLATGDPLPTSPPASTYFPGWQTDIGLKNGLQSISGIINAFVPIAIVLSGLVLFLMLLAGGFTMLSSASNPEAAEKGKQQITTALIGFIIIFAAYWIVQIVEIVLGVNIF